MKLSTYVYEGNQSWGFVLPNPHDEGKDWIFNPAKVERYIKRASTAKTTPLRYSLPEFLGKFTWPDTLMETLRMGPDAMDILHKLCHYTEGFLKFGDRFAIQFSGIAVEKVKILAPLPHTRLLLGLVSNCPSFWRNNSSFKHVSMVPLVHQRPMSSLIHPGEVLGSAGGNVELGVVIGKEGKNVPVDKAYEYIAGYTVIIDTESKYPWMDFEGKHFTDSSELAHHTTWDWYDLCCTSFLGKKSDHFCAMGPYIVTPEEIGNHYDLITQTGHDGIMRDRGHTGAFNTGIERIISWYSSVATLKPGDVFHLGTTGTDGLFVEKGMHHEGMTMQSEIEKIGLLKAVCQKTARTIDSQGPEMTPPAVKDFKKLGKDVIPSAEEWSLDKINNVWMCILNNKNCQETDNIAPAVSPRPFNGPNSCAGWTGNPLVINARATSLSISVQLGMVMKTFAKQVKGEDIKDYILGYTPVISVADNSMWDEFFTHAAPPVNGRIVNTYKHWGDGNNVVTTPVLLDSTKDLKMKLTIEGYGEVEGSTAEYNVGPERTIEYMSGSITLFPGDLISLGRICQTIEIPAGADIDGKKITAEIEGLGTVTAVLQREKI